MPWRPLPSIVHAVCVHQFEPTEQDDLALQIGDEVYITEVNGLKDAQWCRGWLLGQPSLLSALSDDEQRPLRPRAYAGIFPRVCVQVREALAQPERSEGEKEIRDQVQKQELVTNGTQDTLGSTQNGLLNGTSRHEESQSDGTYQRHVDQMIPLDSQPKAPASVKEKAPLPALRVGASSPSAVQEPLIEDIASCIREWHHAKLHNLTLQHDYKALEELFVLVSRLNDARKQLMHNVLTEKELTDLREQIVWDLVKGNKMVDDQVIVRSVAQKGRTLTSKDSLSEVLSLQATMSLRDRPIPSSAKDPHLHHLLVDIRQVPQFLGEPAMLHMYLCSVSSSGRPRPVSEAFAVELTVDESMNTTKLSEEISRTLFTNLSKADVGGEDESDSRLYLICRLFRDEPFRREPLPNSSLAPPQTAASGVSADSEDERTSNTGSRRRRSLTGRGRKGPDANDSTRPATGQSTRNKLQRNVPSSHGQASTTTGSTSRPSTANEKRLRRAAGWSALPVSSLLPKREATDLSLAFWTPALPFEDTGYGDATKGEGWDDVLRLLCHSEQGHFHKADAIGRLNLRVQAFAHNNAASLVRERPALLREVHYTPALSLNGESRLPRSDIYLTLKQPVLPANARAFDPNAGSVPLNCETELRNLQITLEVRTDDGRRIEDAIYPTSNRAPHTAFRTSAVDRGEPWNQTIRLTIPPEDVSKSHIIMSIADGPYFPFALAWVPLWNQKFGFPEDGQQSLALWDYNEFTANLINGRGAYMSLPATMRDLRRMVNPAMASIGIETYLSSTTATQNGDILSMLNLERVKDDALMPLLKRFQHVPDEEIVKFFPQILAALDSILEKCSDLSDSQAEPSGDEIADATLKCLANVFRLTRDRRYPHLGKLLEEYVVGRVCSYPSRLYLIRALRTLLSNPFDARNGRDLRAVLKVTDCILKFTFSSLSIEESEEESFRVLHRELRELFEDIMVLLTNSNSLALPTQVIVVQNFSSWLPEIAAVLSSAQCLGLAIAIVDACSFSRFQLRLQRLVMIHNISCLGMFVDPEMQAKIVSKTASWLRPYWPEVAGVGLKSIATLRLCCTIIRDQQPHMAPLQAQYYIMQLCSAYDMIKNSPSENTTLAAARKDRKHLMFSPLFQSSHPFQTVPVTTKDVPNEILLELTAVIGGFFQDRMLSGKNSDDVQVNGNVEIGEADVGKVLVVLRSIQNSEAFPASWLSFAISFARCQVRMLDWLFESLLVALPDGNQLDDAEDVMEFDEGVWQLWFDAIFALVTSPAVVLENHSDQKRRAVWAIGGDIREAAAQLLRRAWLALGWENEEESRALYGIERMGGYQVQFTTKLVPSIIGTGLAVHTGLRAAALDILKSMIIGEWELSGNLDVVQSGFADAFDTAFRDQRFEAAQAEMLLSTLQGKFDSLKTGQTAELYLSVEKMLREIRRLVELLGTVHALRGDNAASSLEQRMRLLEYLKIANNEDSYVRHIHDTCDAQTNVGNYSSAAMALQLHVDLLQSASSSSAGTDQAKAYEDLGLPVQSVAQRKELLFSRMNDLFRRGHCWDRVLEALEDRNKAYTAMFDSAKLAKAHEEQAEVYKVLYSGEGYKTPRYFRVAFNDIGFASTVLSKTFVYEAAPDEDTAKFASRMRQQYPMAVVLHPGVAAPKGIVNSPVLRISAVNVNRDQLHPINQQSNISPFFRAFHLTSNPRAFATSTRQERPDVSVMEQTVEKTVYHTQEKLPTLLGRSEIVNEESAVLSPIQAAIDRTSRKTLDIAEAARSATPADTKEDDKLIRLIRASVEPNAIDSVTMYHKLLIEGAISQRTSVTGTSTANESVTDDIDEKLVNQRILTVALEEHARAIEQALHTKFNHRLTVKHDLRDKFESSFEPQLFAIYPSGLWRVESQVWNDPAPVQKAVEPAQSGMPLTRDGLESDSETEGQKRPRSRSRRASLRKRLSFLSLSRA